MLSLAWHSEFGFLTSCPTNAGTGLRASVLLHLPGLVLTREIAGTLRAISQVGLTTRGLHGEGSEFVGNFFQISNQTTLGRSEEDLVDHLNRTVLTVIAKEQEARKVLMRDAGIITEDKVWRAYGLLCHARTLDYEEMMNLLSGVRLGVSLRVLPSPPLYELNRIMILTQAAHLEEASGRPDSGKRSARCSEPRAFAGFWQKRAPDAAPRPCRPGDFTRIRHARAGEGDTLGVPRAVAQCRLFPAGAIICERRGEGHRG